MNSASGEFDDNIESSADRTRWSLIEQARSDEPELAQAALSQLAEQCSRVLQNWLNTGPWRLDEATSQDLIQGFLEQKLLTGQLLQHADPQRGRFRNLLFVSFRNFARDRFRAEARLRDVHQARALLTDSASVEEHEQFEISWARELLQRVITAMRLECEQSGQMHVWGIFEGRLLRPVIQCQSPVSYSELASRYGFRSSKEAADCLTTAKRMLRRLMEQTILKYACDAEEVQAELKMLQRIFSTGLSIAPQTDLSTFLPRNEEKPESVDATRVQCSWMFARALDVPAPKTEWSDKELEILCEAFLNRPVQELLILSQSIDLSQQPEDDPTTLKSFFCSPTHSLSILEQLKDWSKHEFTTGDECIPSYLVSMIYFTVISIADQEHQAWLTGLRPESVRSSARLLAEKTWVPSFLSDPLKHFVEKLEN